MTQEAGGCFVTTGKDGFPKDELLLGSEGLTIVVEMGCPPYTCVILPAVGGTGVGMGRTGRELGLKGGTAIGGGGVGSKFDGAGITTGAALGLRVGTTTCGAGLTGSDRAVEGMS